MPSPVEIAQAAARRSQKTLAGVVVTIKRGEDESQEITAVVGTTRTETAVSDSVMVVGRERDYLIDAADYDFGNGPVEPQEHDEIREPDGSQIYCFKVLPIGLEAAWKWSDQFRKVYRLHTKLDSVEED